ncbi:MAG: hypothetical protein SA339_12165 [Methanomassiliicoccus sp.]|nr:hypothetical protein [Methanomassiliicoccus sp.]
MEIKMDQYSLDEMASFFGMVYDRGLKASKNCKQMDCNLRNADGSCLCTDPIKDVVDMIQEARGGRSERLDAFVAKVMAEAESKENRSGA